MYSTTPLPMFGQSSFGDRRASIGGCALCAEVGETPPTAESVLKEVGTVLIAGAVILLVIAMV